MAVESDLLELLKTTNAIFRVLDESDLRALASELEWVQIMGGESLFRQGDPGNGLFFVVSGRFQISVDIGGGLEVLGEIGRGEIVGEMAILTGEPRSATVRAIRDSELVRLANDAFERIVLKNPRAAMLIIRHLVGFLKNQRRATDVRTLSTVGVLAASREAPLTDFSARLATALGKLGPTLRIDRCLVERQLGRDAANSTAEPSMSSLDSWLDQQEANHTFVIYEADPAPSPWTELCIRQADRILHVAEFEAEPSFSDRSVALSNAVAEEELVLLHRDRSRAPAGTRRWLEARRVRTHHHLGAATSPDYDRLARQLTGRALGLVLSGGGARGLAHLGVLRAFEDQGIPIDMIGGTSMGAVIAAQYALGGDFQSLVELNRRGWIGIDPLHDMTLPMVSLVSGKKLDRMLTMMFDDARIEDLWIKYFCVSTNLTRGQPVIHKSGPLKTAVRASTSIPGVVPPLCDNGNLLVDGGVLNNLPADIMRTLFGGKVVAVDASPQVDLVVDASCRQLPSSWQILWSRINPWAYRLNVPNIFALIVRTMMVNSLKSSNLQMEQADLYISPPLDRFGLFDWHQLDHIVDVGYQFTRGKLREWKAMETIEGRQ